MHPIAFFLQFVVHIACVILVVNLCEKIQKILDLFDGQKEKAFACEQLDSTSSFQFFLSQPSAMSNRLIMEIQLEGSLGE